MRKDVRTDRTYLVYGGAAGADMRHRVARGARGSLMFIHHVERGDAVVCHAIDAKRMRGVRGLRVMTLEELGLDGFAASLRGDVALAELSCYYEACRRLGVSGTVMVPPSFPAQAADFLRGRGLGIKIDEPYFSHSLRVKTNGELKGIMRAHEAACAAMDVVSDILAHAEVTADGVLESDGRPLDCGTLLGAAMASMEGAGCGDNGSSVSQGLLAEAGHETGSGPLRAGEPIVVGLRPTEGTGCCADLIRTFVKGEVRTDVAAAHDAAVRAHRTMLGRMRAGARLAKIHEIVMRTAGGAPDGTVLTPVTGYLGSFGHGVGLDPYELPFLAALPGELVEGEVIAVEPGYATSGDGAVVIGDCARVTQTGAKALGDYPSGLEPRSLG